MRPTFWHVWAILSVQELSWNIYKMYNIINVCKEQTSLIFPIFKITILCDHNLLSRAECGPQVGYGWSNESSQWVGYWSRKGEQEPGLGQSSCTDGQQESDIK